MKRKCRLSAFYLVLASAALVNSGCLLVAAGAAGGAAVGYAYCQGKICSAYNAGFEVAWVATRTSLAELNMPLVKEERETAGSGYLESQTAEGEKVRIYLDELDNPLPAEGPQTRICMRVGTFGDQPVCERLFDQVALHLGTAPSTGPPPLADAPPQTAPPPLAN